jgi:hypothetical protein
MPGPFVVSKSSKPTDVFRHDGCVFRVLFLFGSILIHSALLRSGRCLRLTDSTRPLSF